MTLGGKSLLASTLLNGALVAVMASVVWNPTPRIGETPASSDDSGAGWALVMDSPAEAAPSEQVAIELPAEPEIASPTIESVQIEIAQIATPMPPAPTADIIVTSNVSALPAIAAQSMRARIPTISKAGAKPSKKRGTGAQTGAGSGSEGAGSGKSGSLSRTAVYTPAQYASTPRAAYPVAAKKAGISGTAILSVNIDEHGNPTSVSKVKSSGNADLDEAAMQTVKRWRFRPAKIDDRAVPARLQIPVRFALK
jgi:TonB family protein